MTKKLFYTLKRLRSLLPFRDQENANVIIVAGSGRSGTTWLTEQIARELGSRIIFEPLHPKTAPIYDKIPNRKHLPCEYKTQEWKDYLTPIMNGKLRSRWTDRYNHKWSYKTRVIKFVRANLMLGWIINNYTPSKTVFVIRNPLDVGRSQIKGNWPLELKRFYSQASVTEAYPQINAKILTEELTQFETTIAHWAIENRIALDQIQSAQNNTADILICEYERLRDDDDYFQQLLIFCNAKAQNFKHHKNTPSRLTRKKTPNIVKIDESEIKKSMKILDLFGFDPKLLSRD